MIISTSVRFGRVYKNIKFWELLEALVQRYY